MICRRKSRRDNILIGVMSSRDIIIDNSVGLKIFVLKCKGERTNYYADHSVELLVFFIRNLSPQNIRGRTSSFT